uniref:Extracellular calcium sensing receptor n=1 Tax=Taxus chinensis TaxID=29808 RepID=G5DGC7_TAXCH|nr:extracellular calcium sensing receptor [Taxus chinensis]
MAASSRAVGISGLTAAKTAAVLDKTSLSGSSIQTAFFNSFQGKHLCKPPCLRVIAAARGKWDDSVLQKNLHNLPIVLSILTSAGDAMAMTKEDIVTSLTKVEETYQQIEGATSTAYGFSKDVLEQILKAVKPAMDAAMPYLQKVSDSAVQVASPVALDVTQKAQIALENAGVDTKPVLEAAKTAAVIAGGAAEQTTKAIEGAKPIASTTVDSIVSADPIILAEAAGALILLYLFVPSILSSIAFSFRGYKGDLTPAQALELLTKQDYVMIDIRTEKEKSKAGIPSLPRPAKNKLVSIAVEEFPNKLRSLLRKFKQVEAEVTSLKISYLKRLNKGSRIVIMDSYGDVAKIVAKSLTSLGFTHTWILTDGFSGNRGWLQSCLGTESYNTSFAQIFSSSRIIPTNSGTRRILAGGVDD